MTKKLSGSVPSSPKLESAIHSDDSFSGSNDLLYVGHENWSHRRWAWEFLRRNSEYAKSPTELHESMSARARRFGRVEYKLPDSEYGLDDESRLWLAEIVDDFYVCKTDKRREASRLSLKNEDAFIIINLEKTVKTGRTAINSILSDLKGKLNNALDQIEKEREALDMRGPKIVKPRRHLLIHRLKLFDAYSCGASEEQIIRMITKKAPPTGEKLKAIRARIKRTMLHAVEMVNGGYLSLVPLDYIQNKSKAKKAKVKKPK
ncbi:DNA -binding domain-containing protein [Undibacterium danionis]|uniref:DNA -binding domain-containing protein n=1 Tax=Undibacterium danionis TaxID=1812100 RepID=A0ABV6IJF1_9BURK